jgi:RNA polymerase sigma-70 factor (ECF subfamily)
MELSAVDDRLLADIDDESLAMGAAEDFEAFAELYRRHECVIYKIIRAQTPTDDVAEDLTAQVFFKALPGAKTWRGDGSYRSWLYAIAQNSISSYRRAKQRVAVVDVIPEPVDPTPNPDSQVIVGEARDLIWKRVSELPEAQKEAVILRYLKELSIEEVARITRRTKGAVRILLHRARMKLREKLEEHTT